MDAVIDVHFVFLGAAISLVGSLLYARDTFRGLTQPNRVTWVLWTIAPMLAFVAEIRQGVGLQSLMTFSVGFGPLIVLCASFANKNAVWKIGPFDIACGVASCLGLLLWLISSNNTVALASFMAADALAGLPTVVKSWKAPETESVNSYLGAFISALLTLATVTTWTSAEVAFPIQIAVFNTIQITLISGRVGPRLRHEPSPPVSKPVERVIAPTRSEEP
jgi:hypothetical protein